MSKRRPEAGCNNDMAKYKTLFIYVLVGIVVLIIAIAVMQRAVVPALGGVGGSFGIRPQSHMCIGLPVRSSIIRWLPDGDVGFDGILDIRYRVTSGMFERTYCIGQDVWFGE